MNPAFNAYLLAELASVKWYGQRHGRRLDKRPACANCGAAPAPASTTSSQAGFRREATTRVETSSSICRKLVFIHLFIFLFTPWPPA